MTLAPPDRPALQPDVWEYAARQFELQTPHWPTPGALARYCEPTTLQTPALDRIDAAIVDLQQGLTPRELLNAPPQTGKSQRVSRWTPLWLLVCDPKQRLAIVAAEKELAVRWGRQIKRDIEAHPELGLTLREDSRAAGRWETAQGGGLFCTGIAAGTTGRPIDVLIVDDPIKDRAQAESKAMRDRAWDFWENDAGLRSRRALIMSTRWHADDLHGRLLEREPGRWATLAIPAIAEDNDPIGRAVGDELQSANPELHPPGYYTRQREIVSPYVWSSLFQQHPTAAEGGIFKRADWRFWEQGDGLLILDRDRFTLKDCSRFVTIDLATSTRTSADYTVAAAWAITLGGDLVLLDWVRERVPEMDHAAFIEPLRQRWLTAFDVTHIESRMFGTTLVYALGRAGVPVSELEADADKLTRALPYAGLVRQHKVWLPRHSDAQRLDCWLDEHADFPSSAHDDQVDVGAYAARVAIAHWLPPESAEVTHARPEVDGGFLDLMTASF